MKLKILDTPNQILQCESKWNEVAGERGFFNWHWCVQWFKAFAPDEQLHVIVGTDENDRWQGIAPLVVTGRKLRFMGSGTACSDYTNLITAPDQYNVFSESVTQQLASDFAPDGKLVSVDVFEIEGCGGNDSDLDYFCELLTTKEFVKHETETEGTWKVRLPEDFEQLNGTFSKSMRRKTKAAKKRLEQPDVEITLTHHDNFQQNWQTFVDLHQKRRVSMGELGCFFDPKFESFLKSATHGLLTQNQSDLIVINNSAKPIAAMLLIYSDETCMMYQSGLDPELTALEPGYQLARVAINHAIEKECKFFDFLRGDEPYKARWSTTREPILRRKFIPPNISAQLKFSTWMIGKTIKNYVTNIRHTN